MLKARLGVAVFAAVVVFAAFVPFAHAGAGSGTPLPEGTTACRLIVNGTNPTQTLNLSDSTLTAQGVPVGPAVLLCEGVDVGFTASVAKGPLLNTVAAPNAVTCYQVSPSIAQGPSIVLGGTATADISDPFGDGTFQIAGFRLLCVPAHVE